MRPLDRSSRRTLACLALVGLVAATRPAGADPIDLAVGDVLIVATHDRALIRLRPGTGVAEIVVSGGLLVTPYGIDVAPSGLIYLADLDAGILEIDPATGAQRLVTAALDRPTRLAVDLDGTLVVAAGDLVRVFPESGIVDVIVDEEAIDITTFGTVVLDGPDGYLTSGFQSSRVSRRTSLFRVEREPDLLGPVVTQVSSKGNCWDLATLGPDRIYCPDPVQLPRPGFPFETGALYVVDRATGDDEDILFLDDPFGLDVGADGSAWITEELSCAHDRYGVSHLADLPGIADTTYFALDHLVSDCAANRILLNDLVVVDAVGLSAFRAYGKAWLALPATAGLSLAEVVAQLHPQGWRHATLAEVCDLVFQDARPAACPGSAAIPGSDGAALQLDALGAIEDTLVEGPPGEYDLDRASGAIVDDGDASDGLGLATLSYAESCCPVSRTSSWSVGANGLAPGFGSDPAIGHWLVKDTQRPVAIDTLPIGDPGNDPAPGTGLGAVAGEFEMADTEVTHGQYAEFLDAVAATDPWLRHSSMGDVAQGGGILRTGGPAFYSYLAIPSRRDWPVAFVGFGQAVRFANWLHNGQPAGPPGPGTIDDGAYSTSGGTASVTRNPGARFFLPSEDEWYKAAYYDPASGLYRAFPTGAAASCSAPGSTPTTANCDDAVGAVTPVGSYPASAGPFGSLDQGGNLAEWTETSDGTGRVVRGGSWHSPVAELSALVREVRDPAVTDAETGLRVAPEPGRAALLAGGVLALWALGRRRPRRG